MRVAVSSWLGEDSHTAPTRLGRRAYLVKKVNVRLANLPYGGARNFSALNRAW